jgi:DNA-binding NarL/FixJ family response regulator
MIRVLLADDQSLFREALRMLISSQPDLEVVGEASNGEEVICLAQSFQPNVVLMDLQMPVMNGVAATRQLHSTLPDCRVIALTTFDRDEDVFDCLRAGAVGYLLKDAPSENLFAAIRAAARGESFLQPSVTKQVLAEFTRLSERPLVSTSTLVEPLSEREREILRLIANGSSNREIADTLFITEGTVKNHVTNILSKLDVRDRTQAAIKARQLGFN